MDFEVNVETRPKQERWWVGVVECGEVKDEGKGVT